MTINKSQGISVKFVGVDLRIPVFSHGQLYVALSRCTHLVIVQVSFFPVIHPIQRRTLCILRFCYSKGKTILFIHTYRDLIYPRIFWCYVGVE
ncbi:hypothetical protein RHMOL_Rhmol10G0034600 [Rhododendron molle]|uniref:Uncharacterized protein n=1 Tax=Rhododendron molle TaxID=49168 RepID=A0ACC0LZQ5_RHOML|nr:hypothetical protein RHMOL_Rhmol10G0034600 [Rhododendron molle]